MPAEDETNKKLSDLYQFLGHWEATPTRSFSKALQRIDDAARLLGSYHAARERILKQIEISKELITRGHKELRMICDSMDRGRIGTLVAASPRVKAGGKGIILFDEILLEYPDGYGGTKKTRMRVPEFFIPEEDIENLFHRAEQCSK